MAELNTAEDACSNDYAEALASLVVDILISVVGTLSNALVCFTILRTPSLRTNCGYFIVNLAIADLLVSITVAPVSAFSIVHRMLGHCYWQVARASGALAYFMCSASVLNIMFMSLDRCFAILCPLKYKARATHRKVAISIAVIWTSAIVTGLLDFFKVVRKEVCSLLSQSVIGFIYIVIIASYVAIFIQIRKQGKRRAQMQGMRKQNTYKTEWKTARTIALITGVFTVFWAPLGYAFVADPEQSSLHSLFLWASKLGIASSAINPVVYFYSCAKFREAAKKICSCKPQGTRKR